MTDRPALTDWGICFLCQESSNSDTVRTIQPDTYQKVLDRIKERAHLKDQEFIHVHQRISNFSVDDLMTNNAFWHRKCYSHCANRDKIQRLQKKNSPSHGRKRKSEESESICENSGTFTRSSTSPLQKDLCFFCQKDFKTSPINLCTESAGANLKRAIEILKDPVLQTRLNTSISPSDGHAIDVKYHKDCWRRKVFHVIRDYDNRRSKLANDKSHQHACLIEVINLVDFQTRGGEIVSMGDIEVTYRNLLGSRSIEEHQPELSRRWLKEQIMNELKHLRCTRPKDRKKPVNLYFLEACEQEMVEAVTATNEQELKRMKSLYETASHLRSQVGSHTILREDPYQVTSELEDTIPDLYALIRWILVGPIDTIQTHSKETKMNRVALSITQTIMSNYKSDRQVQHIPKNDKNTFKEVKTRETPQALGLSLTVHHDTRSKQLVEFCFNLGIGISYKRTLEVETALANSVIRAMRKTNGVYIPPFLKSGLFVSFAVDNIDFAEDTPQGKGTTHGTVLAVYQQKNTSNNLPLVVSPTTLPVTSNLKLDEYHSPMLTCNKPPPHPPYSVAPFTASSDRLTGSYIRNNFCWTLITSVSQCNGTEDQPARIPFWSGFHSLVSHSQPLTEVGLLPLLPEVVHEWSTLMTVVHQANYIRRMTVGNQYLTILSCDMAVYEKLTKMLDANPELKKSILPRLGELHTTMAALRALGSSIENSGIDDAWRESDVYGPATTRQILACNDYKKAFEAHLYSYQALSSLAFEEFFLAHPAHKVTCDKATMAFEEALSKENVLDRSCHMRDYLQILQDMLEESGVCRDYQIWKDNMSEKAMAKSMFNYLERVEEISAFVAASRLGDLDLHMSAGEALVKLFFGMDRLKYKRLFPRYLADMNDLRQNQPDTWEQLASGGISVTKTDISFTSLGADHALEQENRRLKVSGGLVGITTNANARLRFFLATPQTSYLSTLFKSQFSTQVQEKQHHHTGETSMSRDNEMVTKLRNTIKEHGNPFATVGDQLHNLVSHAYVPDVHVPSILNMDVHGQDLYKSYVTERINGNTSLWAPVKRENNQMYSAGNMKSKIQLRNDSIDLRETKDLYARLLVLSQSSRDIDSKSAIREYEFTLTPRALFHANGDMVKSTDKSLLVDCLTDLVQGKAILPTSSCAVAIIDGMNALQKLQSASLDTVEDLGQAFVNSIQAMTHDCQEVIVVFDTYKTDSLKNSTRAARLESQGVQAIQYKVMDDTKIRHIGLKRFLSHSATKNDLTAYLSDKIIQETKQSTTTFIVSAQGETVCNKNIKFDRNNHEEADTLMIYHGMLCKDRHPATSRVDIFSTDTDVLVLAVAYYSSLPESLFFHGTSIINIKPIWELLGESRARALLGFHAITGTDNTGKFVGIRKPTWFNCFMVAEADIIQALIRLSDNDNITPDQTSSLERFVCMGYQPKDMKVTTISELRWNMFTKNLADSERLPPTSGTLQEHFKRALLHARILGQAIVPIQLFLDPCAYGYYKNESEEICPKTSERPPAPLAVIELVRCKCKTDCSTGRCTCQKNKLVCTELCQCTHECCNTA